jgi:hypothetical protein
VPFARKEWSFLWNKYVKIANVLYSITEEAVRMAEGIDIQK